MLRFIHNAKLASQLLDTIVENVNRATKRVARSLRRRLAIHNSATKWRNYYSTFRFTFDLRLNIVLDSTNRGDKRSRKASKLTIRRLWCVIFVPGFGANCGQRRVVALIKKSRCSHQFLLHIDIYLLSIYLSYHFSLCNVFCDLEAEQRDVSQAQRYIVAKSSWTHQVYWS